MNQLLKQMLVYVFLFALTGQAIADSLSDAKRAYDAGNYAEATKLYRPLAEQGDAPAQLALGMMYEDGKGAPLNYKEAMKWYRLAAEQSTSGMIKAAAQRQLGEMYQFGAGVPLNNKEAVKWYRLAAERGDVSAQSRLGLMYEVGKGVPLNNKEAVKWYRLAAEQGNGSAQLTLGVIYRDGKGVPKDYVLSHMWLNIAAANADNNDKEIHTALLKSVATLKTFMSAQQIAEAQGLARKCTANKFKGC